MDENQKKILPIVAIALLAFAGVAGYLGYQYAPRTEAPVGVKNPNADFINQKAKECQGDASKLSAEDQQKLAKMVGGAQYVGISMNGAYLAQTKT